MKAVLPLLALAAWSMALGAEEPARPRIAVQEVNPWNHLNLNNDPDNFQFAIVTDRTGGHRPGIFEDAIGKLNLLQPEFVMSLGDLIEGYTDAGGRTQLRLKNDADVPLQLAGRFAAHPQLAGRPDSFAVVLAPNSVQLVELEVKAGRPEAVEDLKPLILDWRAEYQQEEVKLPLIEGKSRVVVARTYALPRREQAIAVDGDLGDWHDLPYQVNEPAAINGTAASWTGPADCAWRFGVALGKTHLYIGIETTDDRPVYLGKQAWEQDGVEVRVDGRSDPERSANRGEDDESMKAQVFVGLSPAHPPSQMIAYRAERLQELGVQAICVPTPKGHNTEIAIPLAYIAERQGEDWQAFRLNIAVDDFDEPAGPLAQLWWQPDWRDLDNFAASGTFRKE